MNADKTGAGNNTLVYILAASHSGSTLLAMLLGAHQDICTVGELKTTSLGDVERYRCSCQSKLLECPFWQGIRSDMREKGFPFDWSDTGINIRSGASGYVQKLLRPLHRGPFVEFVRDTLLALSPSWHKNYAINQAKNTALLDCVARRAGNKIVVDSSKIGIRLKYLLRNRHLNVKVIRLVRDGRAVALTYKNPAQFADAKDPSLREGGMGGQRENERLSTRQAAHEWLRSNEEAESVLKTIDKSRYITVKYEDLCLKTDDVLEQVFGFLDVDPKRHDSAFKTIEHHVIGNGMRLDSTNVIKLDDRWTEAMTPQDLQEFDEIGGEKNRELGYQ